MSHPEAVRLRPYAEADFELLGALLGDCEAMRYLGGAETSEQLVARHERYLALDPGANWIFTIELGARPVGWIGYWLTQPDVCEVGWHVLRLEQGRGIATAALAQLVARAREAAVCRYLDAFPSVENAASNALCRAAGFGSLGRVEVEYPKGHSMTATHWRLDLGPAHK